MLNTYTLNNTSVVIDGNSFFYRLYQKSGLQYVFGCESDRYARFLKKHLSMFHKANVTCFFIFKGGSEDLQKKLNYRTGDHLMGRNFVFGQDQEDIVLPVFMKDVYLQVLDEMNFNYTICEFENKREIIAFAQKNGCPIIGFNVEFCFSGVRYIPYPSIEFDETTNKLTAGLFDLDSFLNKYRLNEEKLAVFAALTDEQIFPQNHFRRLFDTLRMPLGNYKRNAAIIGWLGQTSKAQALQTIFLHSKEDKAKFLEALQDIQDLLRHQETPGVPTEYLDNGNSIEVYPQDPQWFEKGVAMKIIPIRLVNIARFQVALGSWSIADFEQNDAMLLSIDIITYMCNLLTNFDNQILHFKANETTVVPLTHPPAIKKPNYNAVTSPFESGWSKSNHGLLEHFLTESLKDVNLEPLQKLPEESRLLMIAFVYFSHKKLTDVTDVVKSVIISHIALSYIFEDGELTNSMGESDKNTAKAILEKYFRNIEMEEAEMILDRQLLHPLVEFQYCIQNLNYLNQLCGSPYISVTYSKVYSASGVYRLLWGEKTWRERGGEGDFLSHLLDTAPSVLALIQHMVKVYQKMQK